MNQTIKNFWAHRRQNAWIVTEIALAAVFSFYVLDYLTVVVYDTYFCRPAGDFEREHLLVGQTGYFQKAEELQVPDSVKQNFNEWYNEWYMLRTLANLNSVRDQLRALPEVQSAGLAGNSLGSGSYYNYLSTYSSEADSTRRCGSYMYDFLLHEQFFETQGLTPIEGSPSAEVLSEECPPDGVVITRSVALALFGTDQVVGRRIVEWDASERALQESGGYQVKKRFTIAGVVEDFRLKPNERYAYTMLAPIKSVGGTSPRMLIRLRPEADVEAFAQKINSSKDPLFQAGDRLLVSVTPYVTYMSNGSARDHSEQFSVLGTFIALLLLNVVLGTLGTFWLQIRKRTEDIGIMRSFGAKRRHIFGMLWSEAALLTLIGCILGQLIWLQFAINTGMAEGFTMSGTGQETNWVNTFWLHYLIISIVQYLLMLAIVTLGMVVPTLRAMYKRPVEALHHD